jgi:hypothetical protein
MSTTVWKKFGSCRSVDATNSWASSDFMLRHYNEI